MQAEIKRWGNSRAIRNPKALAEEAGLDFGTKIELVAENGHLPIVPTEEFHYTLEELVAGITPENRHEEWDTGLPVGREVWW